MTGRWVEALPLSTGRIKLALGITPQAPQDPEMSSSTPAPDPAEQLQQVDAAWLAPQLDQLRAAEAAKNWPTVEATCKQILQRFSDHWEVWRSLALSHEARQDWSQAETLWRHLTERFAARPEPYLALAALQRRQGAPDAARAVLADAERRVGSHHDVQAALQVVDDPWAEARAVPQLGEGASPQQLGQLLEAGRAHRQQGRLQEAEACLQQLVQHKPQLLSLQQELAELRLRRGDGAAVVRQLEGLTLEQQPSLALLWHQGLRQLGRQQESEALLQQLAAAGAASTELLIALAELNLERNAASQATHWLQQAVTRSPASTLAWERLGDATAACGEWPAALEAYGQALLLEPTRQRCAQQLQLARQEECWQQGEQALQQGQWREASSAYRDLLVMAPQHALAQQRLELLGSLNNSRDLLQVNPASGSSDLQQRLQQFDHCLDALEQQLEEQQRRLLHNSVPTPPLN